MREGWEMKKLSDVCQLVNGKAFKKNELLSEGMYPVLRVGNLFTNNQWYYSNLELNEDKYCDYDDLIYAWSASFGPRIWKGEKVIYHYHIWKVIPNFQFIIRDYLFHLFEWDKEQIKLAHGTGTTMMHVGKSSMENRILPIPPLPEQKQIVVLLDQAFAAIAKAKANIEKNRTNAKELFQSKLNEIFSQKGEGWEEKTFKDICILQRGFDLPTRLRKKGEYDLVTSSGVKDSHSEFKVKGPGVVTGRSGSIGNVFYIENNFWPLNTALYIKNFKGNIEKYIYYFLKYFDLSKYSTGTGVPTLNRNFVHDEKVLSTNKETFKRRRNKLFN
ncbi:restriction endonuclease subunit S [uncultured Cyclobacterium sp.]|uniref:restriction endonuclease subunit S n=1 Tax=uncultured Cyclobacterium sp. TaxID=453820 RepID=UPI0030EC495A